MCAELRPLRMCTKLMELRCYRSCKLQKAFWKYSPKLAFITTCNTFEIGDEVHVVVVHELWRTLDCMFVHIDYVGPATGALRESTVVGCSQKPKMHLHLCASTTHQ